MSKIASRWKLTFDPAVSALVLLDFGDYMDSELSWQLGRNVEVVNIAGSEAPFLRMGLNNSFSLDFTVYKTLASDREARSEMMDAMMAYDGLDKKPLKIQMSDDAGTYTGHYFQLAVCALRAFAPRKIEEGRVTRIAKRFSLVGTTLTKV